MGDDMCDTRLELALGTGSFSADNDCKRKPPVKLHLWFLDCAMEKAQAEKTPSMEYEDLKNTIRSTRKNRNNDDDDTDAERHDARKKLRLTKEQSTLLEDSFRVRNTLNLFEKQELAHKLGLRPRQVEVWFQNRRARTKLKQTEVDCQVLKRWCESLNEENRRLRRELQEMRFFDEVSKVEAMRAVCPSCDQRIITVHEEEKADVFVVGKKKAHDSSTVQLAK